MCAKAWKWRELSTSRAGWMDGAERLVVERNSRRAPLVPLDENIDLFSFLRPLPEERISSPCHSVQHSFVLSSPLLRLAAADPTDSPHSGLPPTSRR
jgi:hypothetical protein